MELTQELKETLIKKAYAVADCSYAPYSNFHVGACALYESGEIYIGCNIENSSYGLSLCAERNALSNAIAMGERTDIVAIAIVAKERKNCLPCGACRQWMAEFASDKDIYIILDDDTPFFKTYSLDELLPKTFEL